MTVYAANSGTVFKSINGGGSWSAINAGLTETTVSLLAINPLNPTTLYAGTSYAGVFKSINGGKTWSAVNAGLRPLFVYALAIDPQNPATVYIGTLGGAFKSIDGGGSWSAASTGLNGASVLVLAIDMQDPSTLYAGTHGGVFKSTNGGAGWSAINTGLTSLEVKALAIDPQNPTTIYAGTDSAGVFKSINGGASWSAVNAGLGDSTYVDALAINPQNPMIVYAGTAGGIFKTSDGGASWSAVNTGLTDSSILTLAIDPQNPTTVYAGSGANYGNIFKSINGGANWSTVNAGLTTAIVRALAIDPQNPSILYACAYPGVFKSIDGGASWNVVNAGLNGTSVLVLAIDPLNSMTVYAGTNRGVFKSINGGASWSAVNTGLGGPIIILELVLDPQNPMTVYAGATYSNGTGEGVFKSINGGGSWSAVNTGLTNTFVNALVIDPQNPATLYAGTLAGVFKSINGGASWSAVNTGLSGSYTPVLAIDPQHPMTVYAGTNGGVFKSINGGASWNAVNTGLTSTAIDALAIDPEHPVTVYAGTTAGVFKSINGGASWSAINTGLTNTLIDTLAIDPQNPSIVYAGTNGGGVFVSSATAQVALAVPAGGAVSASTLGPDDELIAGYTNLTVDSGSAPYGTAVFSYTQNGVVVSEAGVPASPPTLSARFFVDTRSNVSTGSGSGTITVLTGFAAVNQGSAAASLNLKLRDSNAATLAQGTVRLARGEHIAKFLDQLAPDFILPSGFINNGLGSLEITSDQPVSILALRLTTNQRGDLLLTSTPIADLTRQASTGVLSFPQIADGGGYQTSLILMNTSNAGETGVVRFYGNNGSALSVRMMSGGAADYRFSYSIPAGGFLRLVTDGSPSEVNVGWAQLTPDAGTTAPVSAAIFSFTQHDVLVTESGVAAATTTIHARIYLDKSGGHDTGLALVNPGISNIRIIAAAYQSDGVTPAGNGPGTVDLVPFGHDAKFAGQFIAGLPEGFTGVLDLSSSGPFPLPFAALTLRSLTNGRGDFLVTTFPIADANQPPPAPLIFPQIADGGGYQTQIILLSTSGAASTITVNYQGNDGSPIAVGQRASGATAVSPGPR